MKTTMTMTKKRRSPEGFGSKPKKPTTEDVTAISNAYAEFVSVVSSGRIEGLANGAQSIYFDDTPLGNPDGSRNFQDVRYKFRPGTANQKLLTGYSRGVQSDTAVGAVVEAGSPITRTIVNENLDGIRITFGLTLQKQESDGDVRGSEIQFTVQTKSGLNAWKLRETITVKGRYPSQTNFEKLYPVKNRGGTVNQFQIRLTRITPQNSSANVAQVLNWVSYSEIIEDKFNYPYSALIGMRLERSQFEQIPIISYDMFGVSDLLIPTNATVSNANRGLNYSGTWDGTFKQAGIATCDPVWQLWDLLTNEEEGLGEWILPEDLNKWHYYTLSRYCNEFVANGKGGVERRFTSNILLVDRQDANKVIEGFRSIFQGFTYYLNGVVNLAGDMPRSPVRQFVPGDVENGDFRYSRPSWASTKTSAVVTWINPENNYERQTVTVRLPASYRRKYGEKAPMEISAFACTSEGQATRAGMAALLGNIDGKVVNFKARLYAAICLPGDLVDIYDYEKSQYAGGGLIRSATTSVVTLDRPVSVSAERSYLLAVMLSDGTRQERAVVVGDGSYTSLTVNPPFASAPPTEASWILCEATMERSLWTILDIVNVGDSQNTMYEVNAIYYNPGKWDLIEKGIDIPVNPLPVRVPTVVNVPRNLTVNPIVVMENGLIVGSSLDCQWLQPINAQGQIDPFISAYFVEHKIGSNGGWQGTQTVTTTTVFLRGLPATQIFVRIAAISIDGNASVWVESLGAVISALPGVRPNYIAISTAETSIFFTD